MAATQSTTAIRSYRIYLRDADNVLSQGHDADLASDEEARELAERMLDEQTDHPCAEIWDRTRLVCTVRKEDLTNRVHNPEQRPQRGASTGESPSAR